MKIILSALFIIFSTLTSTGQSIDIDTSKEKEESSLDYVKFDQNGKLIWGAYHKFKDCVFIVEQFKWNKWVPVAEVKSNNQEKEYNANINLHSSINTIRVKSISNSGEENISEIVKITSLDKEVEMLSLKVKVEIRFSNITDYEIYDSKGEKVATGRDGRINVTGYPKGMFYINYDNKTENFFKR